MTNFDDVDGIDGETGTGGGGGGAQPLWTISALLRATGGAALAPEGVSLSGVAGNVWGISIDSRTLKEGDLYVAIRGDSLDGHDYVEAAFEAGASAALVASDWDGVRDGANISGPMIVVPETLEGMRAIGRAARARCDGRIIAVTGSVGKTGTKEALKYCLAGQGNTHAAEKSFNNHWGVPLTLARMPMDTEYGVFEIGMNHSGEIRPLVEMVRPHIAIITNVEPVHLGHFNSLDEIADAKAEIFEGIEPGGIAILNRDNDYFEHLMGRANEVGVDQVLTFGMDEASDMRLEDVHLDALGSDVAATFRGDILHFRLGIAGRHIVQNALGVLLAVAASGADLPHGAMLLGDIGPQKGRGARKVYDTQEGPVLVIDESYNANPASMRAAFEAMAGTPKSDFPRRIAVLGDMLELGEASQALHIELAESIEKAGIDVVFASGPFMEGLFYSLPEELQGGYALDPDDICQALIDEVAQGDLVMVKGSLGSRMGPIVAALDEHLNES